MPPCVSDSERTHFSGSDLGKKLSGVEKASVRVPAEHGKQRWAAPVIGNIVVLDRSGTSDHAHGKIPGAPNAGVGKVKFPWVFFHRVDDLAEGFPRRLSPHSEDGRAVVDPRD